MKEFALDQIYFVHFMHNAVSRDNTILKIHTNARKNIHSSANECSFAFAAFVMSQKQRFV